MPGGPERPGGIAEAICWHFPKLCVKWGPEMGCKNGVPIWGPKWGPKKGSNMGSKWFPKMGSPKGFKMGSYLGSWGPAISKPSLYNSFSFFEATVRLQMRVPKYRHIWNLPRVKILLGSFVREGWLKVGVCILLGSFVREGWLSKHIHHSQTLPSRFEVRGRCLLVAYSWHPL